MDAIKHYHSIFEKWPEPQIMPDLYWGCIIYFRQVHIFGIEWERGEYDGHFLEITRNDFNNYPTTTGKV